MTAYDQAGLAMLCMMFLVLCFVGGWGVCEVLRQIAAARQKQVAALRRRRVRRDAIRKDAKRSVNFTLS